MNGKIIKWNDDRGFGFIEPESHKGNIFVHISGFRTRSRRPEVGDDVTFSIEQEAQDKVRAKNVKICGLRETPSYKIEPPRKNVIDYGLIVIALSSIGFVIYQYFQTSNIQSGWYYGIPALISFFLLNRQKTPQEKSYRCSKCKKIENFSPRTISAWNSGATRLYCNKCHSEWLKTQPKIDASFQTRRKNQGCLGSVLLMISLPIIIGYYVFIFIT